jgi:hypothetical protein
MICLEEGVLFIMREDINAIFDALSELGGVPSVEVHLQHRGLVSSKVAWLAA